MASLAKAIQEFHKITSGRHPASPGQNATSQVPHSKPPADRPHIRDDSMSEVNLDTSQEGTGLHKVDTSRWASGVDAKDFGKVGESQANPGSHMVQAERGVLAQRKAGDGSPKTWYYFTFNPKTGEYGGDHANPDTDSRLHRDIFDKVVAPSLQSHPRHAGGLPIKYAGITNPNMAIAHGKPNPHFEGNPYLTEQPAGQVVQMHKVDEIVPNNERAAMEPESLAMQGNRGGGAWDSITSYKLPSGRWHHVGEKKTQYGHPDNPLIHVHHVLSSSSNPFDVDATIASLTGDKDRYGVHVNESAVDSQHRKQGFGKTLYGSATMHHGTLQSGDSISRAAHHLYHTFMRHPQFEVEISDKGSEDRHKLTYNGPKRAPTKVWTNPDLGKSEDLEKAMPRFVGEVDPVKEHVAVPHPATGLPTWQHQPAKAKSFQSRIDQHMDRFTSQFGEHGPALKAGLQRVLANKKHADLVVTSLKPGGPHTPRRRHVAYLVTGDPSASVKHLGNGEFLWRQARHGESDANEPATYWKINHQGAQDVTAQYRNSSKDLFAKSDKEPSNKGDGDAASTNPAKAPHDEGRAALGSHGQAPRPLSKSDDAGAASPGVDDARPERDSGHAGGASGGAGALGEGTAELEPENRPWAGGHPAEVSCIAVVDPAAGAILMGRRNDTGKWTNPGGHANKGETPLQCAVRELREETGIAARNLHYLGSRNVSGNDGTEKIIHCFLMLERPEATSRNDPDEEVGQWFWINIKNNRLPDSVMGNLQNSRNVLFHLMGIKQ